MTALSDLVGMDAPVAALRRSLVAGQLSGSYLFTGAEGVGKTSLAVALGAAAACLSPRHDPFDACGRCESCVRVAAGTHPELTLIGPAGDQTQIWQFWKRDNKPGGVLQSTLNYAPAVGRKRVYIVERADTLTEAAANSLLKVLEEPPAYALFILLAPHPSRMLPTILSRCQMIRLHPAPVAEAEGYLRDVIGADSQDAAEVAALAEGRVGTAVTLARRPAALAELHAILDLAESVPLAPRICALQIGETLRKTAAGLKALGSNGGDDAAEASAETAAGEEGAASSAKEKAGRAQLGIVVELVATLYRDLLALCVGGEGASIVCAPRRDRLSEIAAKHPPETWMRCLEELLVARRRIDQNASLSLLTDWLAARLVADNG